MDYRQTQKHSERGAAAEKPVHGPNNTQTSDGDRESVRPFGFNYGYAQKLEEGFKKRWRQHLSPFALTTSSHQSFEDDDDEGDLKQVVPDETQGSQAFTDFLSRIIEFEDFDKIVTGDYDLQYVYIARDKSGKLSFLYEVQPMSSIPVEDPYSAMCIVKAALRLGSKRLKRKGIEGFTIEDIAQEVDFSPPELSYNHDKLHINVIENEGVKSGKVRDIEAPAFSFTKENWKIAKEIIDTYQQIADRYDRFVAGLDEYQGMGDVLLQDMVGDDSDGSKPYINLPLWQAAYDAK